MEALAAKNGPCLSVPLLSVLAQSLLVKKIVKIALSALVSFVAYSLILKAFRFCEYERCVKKFPTEESQEDARYFMNDSSVFTYNSLYIDCGEATELPHDLFDHYIFQNHLKRLTIEGEKLTTLGRVLTPCKGLRELEFEKCLQLGQEEKSSLLEMVKSKE